MATGKVGNNPDFYSEDEDDNVTDYASYTDEHPERTIRLKSGIDLQDLLRQQGVVLEPEQEEPEEQDLETKRYFNANESDIDDVLKEQGEALEDPDDSGDLTIFQRKARCMKSIYKDDLVKKRIIRQGLECDGLVPERAAVTIHFSMSIEDQDEPYDSSYIRGKSERHRLGIGALLPGFEIAIKSMKKQEKAEFLIEPYLAYGKIGCPPRIPGNSQILAKIELLDFAEEGEADAMLAMGPDDRNKQHSYEDMLNVARKEHKTGNNYAKAKEYKLAAKCFERGVRLLEDLELADDEQEMTQKRLLKKLQSNRGYCYINCNWPKKACLALQEAEKIHGCPDNLLDCKIYFRLGLAKKKLGNYQDSMINLKRAHKLNPSDPSIGQEILLVDQIIAQEKRNSQVMCQRMFGNGRQQQAPASPQQRRQPQKVIERHFDDEDYAELLEQLQAFKNDPNQTKLPLPPGMGNMTDLVRQICAELNLKLDDSGRNTYKVVKP